MMYLAAKKYLTIAGLLATFLFLNTSNAQPYTSGGKLTYYGGGNFNSQACLLDNIPASQTPFGLTAAVSNLEYPEACGQFVEINTQNACGTNPPACVGDPFLNRATIKVMITDLCPECPIGHFDLNVSAMQALVSPGMEGTVGIIHDVDWRYIHGEHTGNIAITSRPGTSQWWFSFVVQNHNEPISNVEIKSAGSSTWIDLDRQTGQNFFVGSTGTPYVAPLSVRFTAANGEIIEATNAVTNFSGNTTHDMGLQFSAPQAPTAVPFLNPLSGLLLIVSLLFISKLTLASNKRIFQ